MAPTKVLLASPRGYCAGVDRAVDTGRARARPLRRAGLRAQGDRAQRPRRPRPVRPRRRVRRQRARRARAAASSCSPRTGSRPTCTATARARGLRMIDATCPLVTKVHTEARRFAADGYTIVLIGHEGHEEVVGTMGEAPAAIQLIGSVAEIDGLEIADPERDRLHHADHAVGGRDGRDHRRAAGALPGDRRAEEGRHLLRDPEPAERGQAARARGRPGAGDRLAELVELEPAGRRDPRDGRRRPT